MKTFCYYLLLVSSLSYIVFSSTPSVQEKCQNDFGKLTSCIDFASAKASEPSDKCCSSAQDIRSAEAVCLCYIIQQTYEGLPTLKQLGVRVDRLLQLPTQCKLANSSTSECPKLLNLPANSTEAGIFTSNSTAVTTKSPDTASQTKSNAFIHGPHLAGSILSIAAGFVLAFRVWP